MVYGTAEYAKLFKALREDGETHPAEATRPTLRSDCIKFYDAYRYLSVSRLWGQVGPQPIQIGAIKDLLDMAGVTGSSERLKYLRLIQQLDRIELKHVAETTKKAAG